jgi:hypothetical protein
MGPPALAILRLEPSGRVGDGRGQADAREIRERCHDDCPDEVHHEDGESTESVEEHIEAMLAHDGSLSAMFGKEAEAYIPRSRKGDLSAACHVIVS